MRILFIFLLFAFSSYSAPINTQDSIYLKEIKYDTAPAPIPLNFQEQDLKSFKEDPEFDYSETVEDNWWTRFKRYVELQWHRFQDWIFGDYEAEGILLFLLKTLPYLLIFGILFFALWLFYKLNPGGSLLSETPSGKAFFSEEEEIIQSRDIEKLIKNAISESNFRLAVRYQFLLVLQRLSEKEMVNYDPSKTNNEYISEIQKGEIQDKFRRLARIYDFIWYGNFNTSENDYSQTEKKFQEMQELISK